MSVLATNITKDTVHDDLSVTVDQFDSFGVRVPLEIYTFANVSLTGIEARDGHDVLTVFHTDYAVEGAISGASWDFVSNIASALEADQIDRSATFLAETAAVEFTQANGGTFGEVTLPTGTQEWNAPASPNPGIAHTVIEIDDRILHLEGLEFGLHREFALGGTGGHPAHQPTATAAFTGNLETLSSFLGEGLTNQIAFDEINVTFRRVDAISGSIGGGSAAGPDEVNFLDAETPEVVTSFLLRIESQSGGPINGASGRAGYEEWFEPDGYSLGGLTVTEDGSLAVARTTGIPLNFNFVGLDGVFPILDQALLDNDNLSLTLVGLAPNDDGSTTEVARYTLENAGVSSVGLNVEGGGRDRTAVFLAEDVTVATEVDGVQELCALPTSGDLPSDEIERSIAGAGEKTYAIFGTDIFGIDSFDFGLVRPVGGAGVAAGGISARARLGGEFDTVAVMLAEDLNTNAIRDELTIVTYAPDAAIGKPELAFSYQFEKARMSRLELTGDRDSVDIVFEAFTFGEGANSVSHESFGYVL